MYIADTTVLSAARLRNHVSIPCEGGNFFFLQSIQTISGAHPISYSVATGIERPEHESDYSFPSSVEIENLWSCTLLPPTPPLHGA